MSAMTFDTHEFVKSLEAAGMPSGQAEAISSGMRKAHDGADIATKGDLREAFTRLGAKIDRLDAKLDAKLDMLKWMLVLLTALTIAPFIKAMF